MEFHLSFPTRRTKQTDKQDKQIEKVRLSTIAGDDTLENLEQGSYNTRHLVTTADGKQNVKRLAVGNYSIELKELENLFYRRVVV